MGIFAIRPVFEVKPLIFVNLKEGITRGSWGLGSLGREGGSEGMGCSGGMGKGLGVGWGVDCRRRMMGGLSFLMELTLGV